MPQDPNSASAGESGHNPGTDLESRARTIFDEILSFPNDQELHQRCGGEVPLAARVRALLLAHRAAGHFLGDPTFASAAEAAVADQAGPLHFPADLTVAAPHDEPQQIGPYKLFQKIGEGGFGAVFMAEQEHPIRRRVALKLIKLGMDTRQVIARFDAERQALALMDHPNIARIFDAGATGSGRPYFVMELVRGTPITRYCNEHQLTPRQRLELFLPVCQAVQHAHQKGIIHRDIKPSNVLVTVQDDRPVPKVIDFGIAKATQARLTEKTLFTEHRQMIGTPEYMSPEQADVDAVDIDTRSDIYSLGVLLYELLTGSTPFAAQDLRSKAYAEIQRIIREVDPPRPSTRLSTLANDALPSIATRRSVEPANLARLIRGELDWIVMKCLEKDRQRRYQTANGLAADVLRYLGGEAVVAAPPSRAYRVKKLLRRNKALVAATGAVVASLLIGLIAFAWQARVASKRADELKLVSDFQANMLAQVDPTEAGKQLTRDVTAKFAEAMIKAGVPEDARGEQVKMFSTQWKRVNATDTARELIDRTILKPAIGSIDKQFKDQPVVDAQLRQVLADLYRKLGLYEAAMPLQTSALATRRRVLGEDHPDTLTSLNGMGYLLWAWGKLPEAEPYFRQALQKRRRVLGEEHRGTLESINNMGVLLGARGKLNEAEPYYREALGKSRRVLGEDHPDTLRCIRNMGCLLRDQGKPTEAEPYFRQALEKCRQVLGEEHPNTLASIQNMGNLLRDQGKPAEAEPYLLDVLEKSRHALGEEHPDTLKCIGNMGALRMDQNNLAEAERYYLEAMKKSRLVLGEEHPYTLASINNMGALRKAQGRPAEAESYVLEALTKRRRFLGELHPDTLASINNMGYVLMEQNRLADAEPYLLEAMEKNRQVLGQEHPDTLRSINNLGVLRHAQGKPAEAESFFSEALRGRQRLLGADHPATLESMSNLGDLLMSQGRLAEAEPYLRESAQMTQQKFGVEHRYTLLSTLSLGRLRVAQRKYAAAVDLLAPFEGAARKVFTGENAVGLASLLLSLGEARAGLGRFDQGEANLLEAHSIVVRANGQTEATHECVQALADFYTAWDKAEPGKGYDAKAAQWKASLPTSQPATNRN